MVTVVASVAVLSDIHGVLPALDAVLAEPAVRADEEVVVVDSRLDRWAEVLAGLPEQTMTVVCGHTHMPFTRLAHRRQIINPGSVGMPYEQSSYPGAAQWADYFLHAKASDADALAVMAPRDGRAR